QIIDEMRADEPGAARDKRMLFLCRGHFPHTLSVPRLSSHTPPVPTPTDHTHSHSALPVPTPAVRCIDLRCLVRRVRYPNVGAWPRRDNPILRVVSQCTESDQLGHELA